MKTLSVFRLLFSVLAALVVPGIAYGQTNTPPPPDCQRWFAFTLDGSGTQTGAVQDNRSVGCDTWTLVYQATGTGTLTGVEFQSAPGASVAGTWVTYAGTVNMGSANPLTSSTGEAAYFTNGVVATPWLRVLVTEGSFVGVLNGVYYGYKTGYPGGGGGGGGGGGCTSPCVVIGPDAVGAEPTQDPVQVSGIDNDGNVIRQRQTSAGVPVANGAVSSGDNIPDFNTTLLDLSLSNPIYLRMMPLLFQGNGFDRQFTCNNQALITVAAGTDVVIAAGSMGTNIKICHVSFSQNNPASVTFRQGTGMVCGTNPVDLTGAYANVLGLALDFTPASALNTTTPAQDVCLHFSTSVTAGGVVVYAQY